MPKYKSLEHNVTGYAPFTGAVLVASEWGHKFTNPSINKYIKQKDKYDSARSIIDRVMLHESNEGIIFGGLEWGRNIPELIDLIKLASDDGLKIMIDSCMEELDFYTEVGKQCYTMVGLNDVPDGYEHTYPYIGTIVLDYFIHDDYYVAFGFKDSKRLTKIQKGEEKDEPLEEIRIPTN